MNRIKHFATDFISSGYRNSLDAESLRKIILMNIVCFTGIIFLIPMGGLAFFQNNTTLGLFDFVVAGILLFNLGFLRTTGNYTLVSYFGIVSAMLLFIYLLLTGGVNNSAFVWYYTFPLFAMFLLGIARGTIASLILLVVALFFFIVDPKGPFFAAYPVDLKIRFIPSYVVVIAYSYLFEFMRARAHQKLVSKNMELNNTVDELERTRESLESAQQNLELKVEKRTADLERANAELHAEIAERRRAERELHASNERFITVLNSIDANIYAVDLRTYEILFINRKMAQTFGGDIVGQMCWRAVRNNNEICDDCPNAKLFDPDGRSAGVHVWEYHNSKTKKWYINSDRAIRWTDGRWVKIQVSMDVTDRKHAEKAMAKLNAELERKVAERTWQTTLMNRELRVEIGDRKIAEKELKIAKQIADRSNQAKSEFLANMSHELRTPLNHIIGFTELIVDKHFGGLTPTQEEYLNDVIQSSHHLLSLINDILDISKIEAKKMTLNKSEVDIKQLLSTSLNMIKEKAQKHGIHLSLAVDTIPEFIQADERRLKQIVYNLLSNAVKFTPDGGQIKILADRVNSHQKLSLQHQSLLKQMGQDTFKDAILITVSDSGIGIAQQDLKRIFLPFEQVESSSNRRFQGTGLGLPLTRELVELHGGNLFADSKGEGQGAVFMFTVPI